MEPAVPSESQALKRKRDKSGKFSKRPKISKGIDHTYATASSVSHFNNDLNVGSEVRVNSSNDVMFGRRVIELDVLAEGLKACFFCSTPLHLTDVVQIRGMGLAAILYVQCTSCGNINSVHTGKKHSRIYDMNTKLATAMIHAGVGERQINTILSTLNIPPVSHSMLDDRQKESGIAVESVADESVQQYLDQEANLDEDCNNSIEVSVDAGWQKCGSGKAYSSLSGHCTMIGTKTGKVVGYSVRCKTCRKCSTGNKSHDCRRNWTGSAKAMESDMVASMIVDNAKKGVMTKSIVGDDDATTMSKLRSLDFHITKKSDKNHVTKNLSTSLYLLRKVFPALSTKVINYLLKLFNYNIAENKNDPAAISSGIDAITRHPFGNHECCQNQSWCRFISDPTAKYSSLPYGKPLNDDKLASALDSLFEIYRKQSEKLSSLGSTQANENMNNIIASKAPKSHHYSASASLNFRVAASVAQKNIGHRYVANVRNCSFLVVFEFFVVSLLRLRNIGRNKFTKAEILIKAVSAKSRHREFKRIQLTRKLDTMTYTRYTVH